MNNMYQVSLHPLINVDKHGQSGDTLTIMCHQFFVLMRCMDNKYYCFIIPPQWRFICLHTNVDARWLSRIKILKTFIKLVMFLVISHCCWYLLLRMKRSEKQHTNVNQLTPSAHISSLCLFFVCCCPYTSIEVEYRIVSHIAHRVWCVM